MIDLIKLKSRIEKMEKTEITELFKIIHNNKIKYSKNNNGIFINLENCGEQSINEIKLFMDFIEENRKHINDIEIKIAEKKNNLDVKQNYFNDKYNLENGTIISTDYSPFVTTDNYFSNDQEKMLEIDMKNIETDGEINDIIEINEINDIIELDEDDIENDEELISNSIINQKKKKINTIKSMILKRCKNINQCDNIEDEVNNEEFESTELSVESEYI
jgi:hypothetical protein